MTVDYKGYRLRAVRRLNEDDGSIVMRCQVLRIKNRQDGPEVEFFELETGCSLVDMIDDLKTLIDRKYAK